MDDRTFLRLLPKSRLSSKRLSTEPKFSSWYCTCISISTPWMILETCNYNEYSRGITFVQGFDMMKNKVYNYTQERFKCPPPSGFSANLPPPQNHLSRPRGFFFIPEIKVVRQRISDSTFVFEKQLMVFMLSQIFLQHFTRNIKYLS